MKVHIQFENGRPDALLDRTSLCGREEPPTYAECFSEATCKTCIKLYKSDQTKARFQKNPTKEELKAAVKRFTEQAKRERLRHTVLGYKTILGESGLRSDMLEKCLKLLEDHPSETEILDLLHCLLNDLHNTTLSEKDLKAKNQKLKLKAETMTDILRELVSGNVPSGNHPSGPRMMLCGPGGNARW